MRFSMPALPGIILRMESHNESSPHLRAVEKLVLKDIAAGNF